MIRKSLLVVIIISCTVLFSSGTVMAQDMSSGGSDATLLASGLAGGSGSTIGPDGALYVTEGEAGRLSRIDPSSGEVTTFATGLPPWVIGLGGAMDVAFLDDTAYALVTAVGEDAGGSDVVGIYRMDAPDSFSVVADLGEFSSQNVPTNTEIELVTGVQYAMEPYGEGFLVTDGHHNRVLEVSLDGTVSEVIAFDNIVPTGLALADDTVYMAEAGPVPHIPDQGKVISFGMDSLSPSDVASGARLIVDVEMGPGGGLYALSQGDWAGEAAGTPAEPNTGTLLAVNEDGTFDVVAEGLDRPTSLEFIDNTAYVVTNTGEVWTVEVPEPCTLGTIAGTYVFQGVGVVAQDGTVVPYAEAGVWTVDGEGSGSGVFSAGVNGEAFANAEAFTATLEMTSECVYVATDDLGNEFDLYTTPSGDIITYFSGGFSGVQYRQ